MNNRPWIGKLTHVSLFTILMSSQSLWNMWVVVSQVHMRKGARELWKHAAVHFHTPQCHRWRCDIQPDFIPGVVIIANYYLLCLLWCHFLDNQPISVKRQHNTQLWHHVWRLSLQLLLSGVNTVSSFSILVFNNKIFCEKSIFFYFKCFCLVFYRRLEFFLFLKKKKKHT